MNRVIPAISSSQPGVDPTIGIYSSTKLPIVKVNSIGGDKELIINESDFDPDGYVRLV